MTADLRGELLDRNRDVNLLLDYRRSAATGRGLIAAVSGEAGVGKTRLFVSSRCQSKVDGRTGDTRRGALEAAASFEAIGWPWLAARGYELRGESQRALEAY